MATTFRTLTSNDIVKSRTRLHEYIPITGSILSGSIYSDRNVKSFSHGLYESVYDYPHLSSSANHIMDISFGAFSGSGASHAIAKNDKGRIYQLYSQMLMGFVADTSLHTGKKRQNYGIQFDQDGNIAAGGTKMNECYFVNFSRLLVKDEIKKGSFSLTLGIGRSYTSPFTASATIKDVAVAEKGQTVSYNAANQYRVNATVGEYGFLYMSGSDDSGTAAQHGIIDTNADGNAGTDNAEALSLPVGLIFYQPGILVLTSSIFNDNMFVNDKIAGTGLELTSSGNGSSLSGTKTELYTATIPNLARGFRNRIRNITFNNTVELNSTIYMCRAQLGDYNYSSNPTYISAGSKVVVKNERKDQPVSYMTSVGLYSSDNELLAVAKTSEPLRKDPTNELTMRVRLDY